MNSYRIFALSLLVLIYQAPQTQTAKILITFSFPGRSQYIFAETYIKELAARGHEVTVINSFDSKPVPNIRFIKVSKIEEQHEEIVKSLEKRNWWWERQKMFDRQHTTLSKCILEDPGVQNLMKSNETFDVLVIKMHPTEALYGLAQHFNASLIGFSTFGNDFTFDALMGNIFPLSYNPLITSTRSNIMSFSERLQNHWDMWLDKLAYQLIYYPSIKRLYAQYFPNAKQSLSEVLNSFSLMLIGQHFATSFARPYLPNMIEVGGMHIVHKPKPLPLDIQQFIESAPEGVIYFSLGSNYKSKDLPPETRETLLTVFGGLKQRVLWKFEDDQMPGMPYNVLIRKWFPQRDILAHPNVKLFISHGGMLSTTECAYFGKPVLGLPIFLDQFMNIKRATSMGFGLSLNLKNLTQADLEQSITTLLTTPSFAKTAQAISERFRDQPESSLDRAIWWTEYVIRHKGAHHMRAASRDLNYLQLHSVDTLAVLLGIPLFSLLLVVYLVYWFVHLDFGDNKSNIKQKQC